MVIFFLENLFFFDKTVGVNTQRCHERKVLPVLSGPCFDLCVLEVEIASKEMFSCRLHEKAEWGSPALSMGFWSTSAGCGWTPRLLIR